MTTDINKLTQALRRDTPEYLLMKSLIERKDELIQTLKSGKDFTIRDVCGRLFKISINK